MLYPKVVLYNPPQQNNFLVVSRIDSRVCIDMWYGFHMKPNTKTDRGHTLKLYFKTKPNQYINLFRPILS